MKPIEEIWGLKLYDKIWSSTSHSSQYVKLITSALRSSKKVLDMGVGVGNVFKKLVDEGKEVYGIDVNQKAVDYTKKKIGKKKRVILKKSDACKLSFDNKFNAVVTSNILHYFTNKDLDRVMKGVYRALKPNGLFTIVGYEETKRRNWAKFTGEEIGKAIKQGRIILTASELKKLPLAQKYSLKTKDSSARTLSALRRNRFRIIKNRKFYHDTCYFIIAQKA